MRVLALLSLAGVTFAGVACHDVPTEPADVHPEPMALLQSVDSDLQRRLDRVAAAVAAAAASEEVRRGISAAADASEAPEGKVFLKSALTEGTALASHIGVATTDQGGVDSLLEGLPPLDFYVAREDDRRTWGGNGPLVAVIGVADPDQGVGRVYFSDGRTEVITDPSAVVADALLAIHPTERPTGDWSEFDPSLGPLIRPAFQAPVAGEVGALDRTGGLDFSCEPGADECGGGGGSGYAISRVGSFVVYFSDWIGTAEVEFRATARCGSAVVDSGIFRRTGVYMGLSNPGGTLIAGFAPSQCFGGSLAVELWETDPFGLDDYFGSRTWTSAQNGLLGDFLYGYQTGIATVNWVYVP